MKKLLLPIIALLCMANSKCADGSFEVEKNTYYVVDKGTNIESHFNPFHRDNFEVGTDYFVTLRNEKTKKTFVHKCYNGEEYYGFEKSKRYRCTKFREEKY